MCIERISKSEFNFSYIKLSFLTSTCQRETEKMNAINFTILESNSETRALHSHLQHILLNLPANSTRPLNITSSPIGCCGGRQQRNNQSGEPTQRTQPLKVDGDRKKGVGKSAEHD